MDQTPTRPDVQSPEARLLERLTSRRLSLAVAESLTGGLLAAVLTSVPGASAAFRGGVVAYSDLAKTQVLAVPALMISQASAVSAEVAEAMARGVRRLFGADVAVAVTGEAGPTSASGRPVGTVFLAICSRDEVRVRQLDVSGDRESVRRQVVQQALEGLLDWACR